MKLVRRSRFIAALVALVSVLFAQLAVAAYVCPNTQLTRALATIQLSEALADHGGSPGCELAIGDSQVQCHSQGQVGTQSLDKPQTPNILPFSAITPLAEINRADVSLHVDTQAANPLILRRAIAPPLSIRNCCFRF